MQTEIIDILTVDSKSSDNLKHFLSKESFCFIESRSGDVHFLNDYRQTSFLKYQ